MDSQLLTACLCGLTGRLTICKLIIGSSLVVIILPVVAQTSLIPSTSNERLPNIDRFPQPLPISLFGFEEK
ncbi:hypothetical protein [Mastigocoleus testarum]|uniref:Uncharacterized protein n=1 Tax=Mastigocoleus testarum BC008 TaxID=371196 RepID=A0A0V7ZD18_9CYAN|nr:hypothetical protein [Mastigocoleus testarum]KST62421.1 hypothetical protein BC008_09635 [Mastigocoleus testarum BC008]